MSSENGSHLNWQLIIPIIAAVIAVTGTIIVAIINANSNRDIAGLALTERALAPSETIQALTFQAQLGAAQYFQIQTTTSLAAGSSQTPTLTATTTLTPAVGVTPSVTNTLTDTVEAINTPTATFTPTNTPTLTPTTISAPSNAPTSTLTPILSPDLGRTLVAHNADWQPYERDFEGVTMVLVPAGCFDMGNDPLSINGGAYGGLQCFDEPFWIDKYEVSNGQFTEFSGQATHVSEWTASGLPREWISWREANAFCRGRSARLPTEAEWEYAARGPDGLAYPWGNGWNPQYLTWNTTRPAAVTSHPEGASWVGALNMSGNVYEWASSFDMSYPYTGAHENDTDRSSERIVRGGSWNLADSHLLRAASRAKYDPTYGFNYVGLRCARDAE